MVKIIKKAKSAAIKFGDIKSGTVFSQGTDYYMKGQDLENDSEELNAINLSNGLLDFFEPDEDIYPCDNAEIVVYD